MRLLAAARDHWRVTLLTVMLVISLFLLFAPVDGLGPDPVELDGDRAERAGITNLHWGLDLSGGASVRSPLIGWIAADLEFEPENETDIVIEVAGHLDINERDVTARAGERPGDGSIETTDANVTRSEFVAALQAAGFAVTDNDVERGVHPETLERTAEVLYQKFAEAGYSGHRVDTFTGQGFVVIEVPQASEEDVLEIIRERGLLEVKAHFPVDDNYQNETLLRQGDFAHVDNAERNGDHGPHVPVQVDGAHAGEFASNMESYGFADPGGARCNWQAPGPRPDDPGHCLLTVLDGEVVYAAGVDPDFADTLRTSNFVDRPTFIMRTTEFEHAQALSINLQAGALPAELDLDRGDRFSTAPTLAERFRSLSLLVGLAAALAVAGMVYWRYREPRVAAPMLLTASSEVVILLAVTVLAGYALDLAAIAGFIAVLGTGVDDLIIIADEVMQRGEIRTDRVFEDRFRKAFWVIGVAAATTIIAMSPLVSMSLGDLSNFAIITIMGVLIGVLITRPAYGNILRILMLD